MIPSRRALALGSLKTIARIASRSSAPCAVTTPAPMLSQWELSQFRLPSLRRGIWHQRSSVAPRSANICLYGVLPLPIPPVRPSRNAATVKGRPPGEASQARRSERTASAGQKWTKRHIATFHAAIADLHGNTHDGADDGGDQDHRNQGLPAKPRAQRCIEFKVTKAHTLCQWPV